MRGVYKARIEVTAVDAAKVLLHGVLPATKCIEIYRASVTASDEDTAEQILCQLNRVATAGAPAGTSVTAKPTEEGSSASGVTWLGNLTTDPTAYDSDSDALAHHGENKSAGWDYEPLLEEREVIVPSDIIVLRTVDAITASTLIAEILYREIG